MANAKAAGAKAAWQSLTGGLGYMGISLDSRNHQGEALEAMVDWINTHGNFRRVRVGLSDTLNRFNIAHSQGVPLATAFNTATKAGDKWLAENYRTLRRINKPFDLVRWSHWLDNCSDEVNRNKGLFTQLYLDNKQFRDSVHADIERFTKRKTGLSVDQLDQATLKASLDYLIEEVAVYSVIFDRFPGTAVYPGKQLECFRFLRVHKPDGLPNGIARTGHIRLAIHESKSDAPKVAA